MQENNEGWRRKAYLLYVSETNNACLSLSSSDDENESGGRDLHQCGHCRQMFYNFTEYIKHKLQKTCWNPNATSTDEAAAWPLDSNGISSPCEKETEAEMEGNIEVKNLHQDLQKRKHRKGTVRRIKPTEDTETTSNEPMVYVPADEDTVYVQAENVEETDVSNTEEGQGPNEGDKESEGSKKPSRNSGMNKYGVSLYNYSCSKMKVNHTENGQSPTDPTSSALDLGKASRSPKGLGSPQSYQRGQFSQNYYHDTPLKKERGFYPETGARYLGDYGPYAKYRKSKYYDEPPTSFYPPALPHRSKGSSYNTDRYKSDTYLPYDKYRTMANLPADENKTTKKKDQINDNNSTANNDAMESENMGKNTCVDDAATPNLPQLVHASQNKLPQEENSNSEERTPVYDKSPPALEKCESSFAEGDSLKTEGEESRDSVNDGVGDEGKMNEDTQQPTDNADSKFVMSPEKESDSPQGSSHSHETEDYTQDGGNREPPEIRIPRHRQLSESTVERLITEPGSQSDASWKHAKQVYRCPLCAKIFPFKSKLQRHVLVHTGIKPYKCSVCGRGFTQQIDLQRHLTRHTGEKPFKCHLCKAQFIRADNLRKHCKDAHYVNIEEPIRKRRRKTTGSDTVLPPLEVAIALALSETERNGGRVLGRATTRANTRTTTNGNKVRQAPAENTMPHPPRPEDVHPSMYPPRMSSRPDGAAYPPNYPPQLGLRQSIRYSFHHGPDGATAYGRRPRSPSEFDTNSPPYHHGGEGRYIRAGEQAGRYYQAPPTRGYFVRPGYERESEVFYQEKGEGRVVPQSKVHSYKVQDYRGIPMDTSPANTYSSKRPTEHSGRPRAEDVEYAQEMRKREEEYGPDNYRLSTRQKHSPGEFIKPRERESSSPSLRAEDRERSRNPYSIAPRAEEDHRALFRGKPSISYGDYTATSRSSEQTMVSHDYRAAESSYQRSSTSDPGEFVTMATADKDSNLIEPRSTSPASGAEELATNLDANTSSSNVYVDEQETPIVTPSDDHSLATSSAAVAVDS